MYQANYKPRAASTAFEETKLKSKVGVLRVLSLRKIEPLPAALPNRTATSAQKNQEKSKSRTSNPPRICCASTKVQARTVGSKKIRPNRNCASQTRTAQGNPAADLERSYQLPPRRKPSPAEREMGGEGSQLVPSMRRPGRRPRRRLDWSGCWSWSWSGRATTTPNCLGAAPWSLDGRPSPKKRHPSPSGNRRKEMEKGGIFI